MDAQGKIITGNLRHTPARKQTATYGAGASAHPPEQSPSSLSFKKSIYVTRKKKIPMGKIKSFSSGPTVHIFLVH